MQTGGNSIKRALAALAVAGIFLWAAPGYAARFDQRGVAVPEAPELQGQRITHLGSDNNGAALSLPREPQAAWQLLNRALDGLGIKLVEQDEEQRRLRTGWVLWTWDPDSGTGNSKPPLKALSRTFERHRFEFSVNADVTGKGAVIEVRDAARQREVDITPDSEYTWLKWIDAKPQAAAAQSFLRRLQGDIESALSTSIVPATGSAPRIIEPVEPAASGDQRSVPAATDSATPAAVIVEPAPVVTAPTGSGQAAQRRSVPQPVQAQMARPTESAASPPPVPAVPPAKAEAIETTEQTAAASPTPTPTPTPKESLASPRPPAPVATPSPHADTAPVPAAPRTVQGGLLVNAGPDATWQELIEALNSLGVTLQSDDQRQHILSTNWIDARYDRKNQQFLLESKQGPLWAFNLWGKGRERHRFQLILIPVAGAARTMVYAYHTGFQEETDRTPDSSQTLLYWKDHATEPAIALAFLRRLRLVVNP